VPTAPHKVPAVRGEVVLASFVVCTAVLFGLLVLLSAWASGASL
jgi:hypothetical protein